MINVGLSPECLASSLALFGLIVQTAFAVDQSCSSHPVIMESVNDEPSQHTMDFLYFMEPESIAQSLNVLKCIDTGCPHAVDGYWHQHQLRLPPDFTSKEAQRGLFSLQDIIHF